MKLDLVTFWFGNFMHVFANVFLNIQSAKGPPAAGRLPSGLRFAQYKEHPISNKRGIVREFYGVNKPARYNDELWGSSCS